MGVTGLIAQGRTLEHSEAGLLIVPGEAVLWPIPSPSSVPKSRGWPVLSGSDLIEQLKASWAMGSQAQPDIAVLPMTGPESAGPAVSHRHGGPHWALAPATVSVLVWSREPLA